MGDGVEVAEGMVLKVPLLVFLRDWDFIGHLSCESPRPAAHVQNGLSSIVSWKNLKRVDFKVAADALGASRVIWSGNGQSD